MWYFVLDEVTCCAVDAFKRFTELQDKLKQVENMYQPLVTNAQVSSLPRRVGGGGGVRLPW